MDKIKMESLKIKEKLPIDYFKRGKIEKIEFFFKNMKKTKKRF